jgi:hypothetical protein
MGAHRTYAEEERAVALSESVVTEADASPLRTTNHTIFLPPNA